MTAEGFPLGKWIVNLPWQKVNVARLNAGKSENFRMTPEREKLPHAVAEKTLFYLRQAESMGVAVHWKVALQVIAAEERRKVLMAKNETNGLMFRIVK